MLYEVITFTTSIGFGGARDLAVPIYNADDSLVQTLTGDLGFVITSYSIHYTKLYECAANSVRLEIVGRRDRLDPRLRAAIDAAELATRGGAHLHLRIAVDYSARHAILRAAARFRRSMPMTRNNFV